MICQTSHKWLNMLFWSPTPITVLKGIPITLIILDIIISLYVERDEESELKDPPTTSSGIQLETGKTCRLFILFILHGIDK